MQITGNMKMGQRNICVEKKSNRMKFKSGNGLNQSKNDQM